MLSCFLYAHTLSPKNKNISLHRLPKTEPHRQQWIQFFEVCQADLSKIKASSAICNAHFKADCFKNYIRVKLLKEDAVPSIIINCLKWLQDTELEGFKKLPDETDCEEQNLPQNCFPSTSSNVEVTFTSYILRKPSHKSQSMDYMINATVSEDTKKIFLKQSVLSIADWYKKKRKKSNY